jgi:hypothetical protein
MGAEVGIVLEDPPLHRVELRAGLEPELVRKTSPGRLEDRESVLLAARAVQSEHQLRGRPLAVRMLAHKPFQVGDDVGVS